MRMMSIRRHLLVWLLPGFLLLWAGAGSAIYFSIKQRHEAQLDAELRELWAALPFGDRSARVSLLSIEDFAKDDFGIYFQIWDQQGNRILKSENLGRFELPQTGSFGSEPEYRDQRLGNGDLVRTLSVGSTGGSLGPLKMIVATSWEENTADLRKSLIAIIAVGLLTGIGFAILLSLALRSGLKPLVGVGEQASRIEADTLSTRFPTKGLPGELRPIAERLNDLMSRLEESFAREKRFGADLAHEFRTPVAALRSLAEVAIKWPEQTSIEDYEDVLEISCELQVTIENLLTLARLENAKEQLVSEQIKVHALIEDCWLLFAPRATERGLAFRNSIDPDLTFESDPKLLRLIITNLLSNAAEYATGNSDILVTGDVTGLFVTNPAPHLTKDDLPKMFDRLWRHDQARTDSSHSGLGLSLAKTCAEVLSFDLTADLEGGSVRFSLKTS